MEHIDDSEQTKNSSRTSWEPQAYFSHVYVVHTQTAQKKQLRSHQAPFKANMLIINMKLNQNGENIITSIYRYHHMRCIGLLLEQHGELLADRDVPRSSSSSRDISSFPCHTQQQTLLGDALTSHLTSQRKYSRKVNRRAMKMEFKSNKAHTGQPCQASTESNNESRRESFFFSKHFQIVSF